MHIGFAAGHGGYALKEPILKAVRDVWLPATLIQAKCDGFRARTCELVDAKGVFQTRWE
jgi:6-phosphogluconate dehydrogenase